MNSRVFSLSLFVFIAGLLVSACSSSPEYKGVYETKRDDRPLEVPPDLSLPDSQNGLNIPKGLASQQALLKGSLTVAPQRGPARLQRDGSVVWLQVDADTNSVWMQMQDFLRGLGFAIKQEDLAVGIMETDWRENRVDVPTNWIGRIFKKFYSSGLLDMYRIRLEQASEGKQTLVFISHRGMREIYEPDSLGQYADTKGWQVREPDPELEVEMLQRFALHLGGDKQQLQQQAAAIKGQDSFASVIQDQGVTALSIKENFDRSWRRVGLALDRLGVIIEDRDRSKGLYFIRLPEAMLQEDAEGWVAKLFGSKQQITETQYVLKLIEQDDHTLVGVLDRKGQPMSGPFADRVLNQVKMNLI